jgi:flagellar FliJ protein
MAMAANSTQPDVGMFIFRFETLLTTRRHAEEVRQKELSEAKRALASEQALLRESRESRRRSLTELGRRQGVDFRAADLALFGSYLDRLAREIDARMKRVAAAERRVAQQRLLVVEAMKRRKVLEKLREKDEREFRETHARNERKFIDEIATGRHARSSGPPR